MITFKVTPEYTIATDYAAGCIVMDEWSGKTAEEFTSAMGREADSVETYEIAGRTITEYSWNK